jgi:hypothetical protein
LGWVRSRREAVRRLKERLGEDCFVITLEDGTTERFLTADFYDNFMQNTKRLRALYRGDEVPPPHRLAQALTEAHNLPPELAEAAEAQRRLNAQVTQTSVATTDD